MNSDWDAGGTVPQFRVLTAIAEEAGSPAPWSPSSRDQVVADLFGEGTHMHKPTLRHGDIYITKKAIKGLEGWLSGEEH